MSNEIYFQIAIDQLVLFVITQRSANIFILQNEIDEYLRIEWGARLPVHSFFVDFGQLRRQILRNFSEKQTKKKIVVNVCSSRGIPEFSELLTSH